MIKALIDGMVHNTWPSEIELFAQSLALAAPVLLIMALVWICARAGQWLIDRCTVPRPPAMRTADAAQIERDVLQLWQRRTGFEPTYPVPDDKGQP